MTSETSQSFFNLPSVGRTSDFGHKKHFGPSVKTTVTTNWSTFEDQPMSSGALIDVFADRIPVVRVKNFLTSDECTRMLEVIRTHQLGAYDTENTWPRVGVSGITQYDHIKDKTQYFDRVTEARTLQDRWKKEADIDILERVMDKLRSVTDMDVRVASEDDKEYFAGILRAMDRGIGVHADYAPYEAAGWKIGDCVAQVTWNILLNTVPGGDTIIYDRQWQAPDDDIAWRKKFPRDSYHPQMLQGHPFKAMEAVAGDLTLFNPRNFHEVKACDVSRDHPVHDIRFTVSSFIGFLPGDATRPDSLVLWS
ncbi:uncharacterized protein LY79DRAFT_136241 [Colletotrichum navitas]|uniref:Uncharacterized protein n=1 Tax=Colletotrichum navitas TaxID=681940 RepID=A0AAD8UYC0_9PEZI|nr:uncharacterized protein LY79DRAFT_136241 [Colletotrichum navitas]KAK1564267.1 hypothetical protein LY79DRAFT_136241 [Colletotrichum navitas]